ncbi:MAG: hypothetical protein HC831_13110 [Chloroflexia bacterium]|nr:hypothetical protein [Chloroflexia bacterium]
MKSKLVLLLFIFLPLASVSQNKWNIIFGTEEFTGLVRKNLPEDLPQKIVQNNEGAYYISGTNSLKDGEPKPGSQGAWIAKFSAEGKLIWYRVADPSYLNCFPNQLTATSDGGVVLTGHDRGPAPNYDADGLAIYKLDKTGELVKRYI